MVDSLIYYRRDKFSSVFTTLLEVSARKIHTLGNLWSKPYALKENRICYVSISRTEWFANVSMFAINPYRKPILRFSTRQINPRSLGSWCVRGIEESNLQIGFFGSFDASWSERSCIDLFNKETQKPFSDSLTFKNPILVDFLKEMYPLVCTPPERKIIHIWRLYAQLLSAQFSITIEDIWLKWWISYLVMK